MFIFAMLVLSLIIFIDNHGISIETNRIYPEAIDKV